MKLYLVRHGEAVSPSSDPLQPLSYQGQIEAEKVAKALLKTQLPIETILHSEKLRARQTAEIIQNNLETSHLQSFAYLKPNDSIEPLLKELSFHENLLVVGHLPYLEELLHYLLTKNKATSFMHFTTCCIAALSNNNSFWQLDWFLTPNLISQLSA